MNLALTILKFIMVCNFRYDVCYFYYLLAIFLNVNIWFFRDRHCFSFANTSLVSMVIQQMYGFPAGLIFSLFNFFGHFFRWDHGFAH